MSEQHGSVAVSLHYDGEHAPTVSAKGEGDVARRILEIATAHDIPIYQNAELLQFLSRVDLDTEIPPELYVAVAEIIAFAYRLKDRVPAQYYYRGGPDTVYDHEASDTDPSSTAENDSESAP